MKNFITIILIGVCILLSGCGQQSISTDVATFDMPISKPEETATPEPTSIPTINAEVQEYISAMEIYTYTITDSKGYKVEVTLKLGDWLKGSDFNFLNDVWIMSGAKSDFPTITSVNRGSYLGTTNFGMSGAVFTVGTISFENITGNGFDMTESSNQDKIWFQLEFPDGYSNSYSVSGCEYSEGSGDNTTYKVSVNGGDLYISPLMRLNVWGPTPIFLGIDSIFTPNMPNGNPKLDDVSFRVVIPGGYSVYKDIPRIKLDKTW